ncbi:hypothetical protein HK097_002209 [Rhizophlyctis rosea]|uniref:Chromo domain-containing protein n=1 Tax=Rhizophlyctis rosea TaxID=64517 RepID=A0AAD5SIW7_9FUNG|nr:hypothetical protein HK097_002209 [Rhizophlyctis rosea]
MSYSTKKSAEEIEADESTHAAIAEDVVNRASKSFKGKSGKTSDIQVDDWVRLRLFDKSGIVHRTRTGYWSDEIYKVTSIYQPRKIANVSQSFRLENKDTGEVKKGLWSLGQVLKVPKDTETLAAPPRNPPAVNENDVSDDDYLEWQLDSILKHKVVRATRRKPEHLMFQVKYSGYRKLYWIPESDF